MGRWQRSMELVKAFWATLRQDKELMVLPLISGLASILIAATFLVPVFLTSTSSGSGGDTSFGPLQYVLFFAMYVVLAYVAIFFKTALLCGADERMQGGNPSVGSALSAATKHAGAILPWALVSATVSVVLRAIEQRSGLLGRIVIGIVGMAWTVVTFLVLPILVFEGVGVGDAVKRSTQMLKQTWGENLIVNGGLGIVTFVLMIPAFVVGGIGIASGSIAIAAPLVTIAVVWFIAVTCWSNAMSSVFQLALYRYATAGAALGGFTEAELGGAFRQEGAGGRRFGF